MRASPQPLCPNCNAQGAVLYEALDDRLFAAPGRWTMRRCTSCDCGALWLDPCPTREDLPQAYAGYYTHGRESRKDSALRRALREGYAAQMLGYPRPRLWLGRLIGPLLGLLPKRRESTLYQWFYLPAQRDGRVLEVGCGAGAQLETLRDGGWQAVGVDFDPQAADVARAKGLEVLVGDVRDLGLPDADFDAVVMAHVIEHVHQPVGLLAECSRLLRPNGRLVCITPNAASYGHRRFGRDWRGLEPPRHLTVFTPGALALAALRAGLEVQTVRVTSRDATNLLFASARIANAPPGARVPVPTAQDSPPWRWRAMEAVETLASWFGLHWGEELVLIARKPESIACKEPAR